MKYIIELMIPVFFLASCALLPSSNSIVPSMSSSKQTTVSYGPYSLIIYGDTQPIGGGTPYYRQNCLSDEVPTLRIWGDGLMYVDKDPGPSFTDIQTGQLTAAETKELFNYLLDKGFYYLWDYTQGASPAATYDNLGAQINLETIEYHDVSQNPVTNTDYFQNLLNKVVPLTTQSPVPLRIEQTAEKKAAFWQCGIEGMSTPFPIFSVQTNTPRPASPAFTPGPPPTDFPPGYQPNRRASPTPDMSKITPLPTPTEFKVERTNDLSPDLALEDKYQIIVRHDNGTIEEYLIGPEPVDAFKYIKQGRLPPEILIRLNLKSDDMIIRWDTPVYKGGGMVQPTRPPEESIPTLGVIDGSTPDLTTPTPVVSYPSP